jgi:hypothetical protein
LESEKEKMKITKYGWIFALKNIGTWLASYTIADIRIDPSSFVYALIIFIFINVPSDLLLANHLSTESKKKAIEELKKKGK